MNGVLMAALCGEFAKDFDSKCLTFFYTDVKIDSPSMIWREAIERLIKKLSTSKNISVSSNTKVYSPNTCAGFGITQEVGENFLKITPEWIPGTFCQIATPPTLTCSSSISDAVVDFGAVAPQAVAAARKTVTLTTRCNAATSVTLMPV